jgi:hypothetical protein
MQKLITFILVVSLTMTIGLDPANAASPRSYKKDNTLGSSFVDVANISIPKVSHPQTANLLCRAINGNNLKAMAALLSQQTISTHESDIGPNSVIHVALAL